MIQYLLFGVFAYFVGVFIGRKLSFGKALDLNDLAITVAMLEGKKKATNIAQVKEVIARTFDVLSMHTKDIVYKTIKKGNA